MDEFNHSNELYVIVNAVCNSHTAIDQYLLAFHF